MSNPKLKMKDDESKREGRRLALGSEKDFTLYHLSKKYETIQTPLADV